MNVTPLDTNRARVKRLLLVTMLVSAAMLSTQAVTTTWNNPDSGDWNVETNWDTLAVPVSGDVVRINVGIAYITNDAPEITSLQLGQISGISELHVGANLTIANNIIGVGSGTFAATNSIIQTNGIVTVIGSTTSSVLTNGLYDVSGGELQINNNRRLDVSGTLRISGNAAVYVGGGTTSTPRFGATVGTTGVGIQSGGTLTAGGSFFIGNQGAGLYTLSGGTIWASNNFTLGSSTTGPGNGTLDQSGGLVVVGSELVANSGTTFIGQNGPGVLNLSGGTFVSRAFSIGSGATANGTVNQTGGTIDLVNSPTGAGSLAVGVSGVAVYSIQNGTLLASNVTVNGTANIGSNATINCIGVLGLGAAGVINFNFHAAGASSLIFTSTDTGVINPTGTINVDGSAYTGGAGSFTLINAAAFDNTPVINVTGFALGATHEWDTANGNFIVRVGPVELPRPTITYSLGSGTLELSWPGTYLGWLAQSNAVDAAEAGQWFDITGSEAATQLSVPINPSLANVFYRLRNP